MVISQSCIPPLKKAGHFGKEIGQLSCDLSDGLEHFSKIIKGIWAAPKGPYSLVYLNKGETLLKEKIRAKGMQKEGRSLQEPHQITENLVGN